MVGLFILVVVVLSVGFGVLYAVISNPGSPPLEMPPGLVGLDTNRGVELLEQAEGVADHGGLQAAFQTQEKGSWCGVASSVTVLNARGAALAQADFFSDRATKIRSWFWVTFGGMTLRDLAGMIAAHGATTEVHYAEDEDVDRFRGEVARNLAQAGDWLIINYDRAAIGEAGGGHISPLSAYDADSDRVLVLDTASYKYPPHWIPVAQLIDAMNSQDSESGRSRGWLVVR